MLDKYSKVFLEYKYLYTCKNDPKKTRKRLASLYNTPCTRELLSLDNTVAKDLRAVEVAAKEQSIDPSTHGVTVEPRHKINTQHGEG